MPLGRGLGSLLSESRKAKELKQEQYDIEKSEENKIIHDVNAVTELSIDLLQASIYQPRRTFDDPGIVELANSIREHGVLEPLIVKKANDSSGKYEIICGERRYRACKEAGLKKVPCFVRDLAKNDAYAIALVENIQREDLNPLEQASALEQMLNECGMSQQDLAKTLGKSRSSVTNILRINKLEPAVKEMVGSGQLDLGHAKVLLGLEGNLQLKAAEVVVKKQLTVRQTEDFVNDIKEKGTDEQEQSVKKTVKPQSLCEFEGILSKFFSGLKIKLGGNENKGKLTIAYSSPEEFARLKHLLEK